MALGRESKVIVTLDTLHQILEMSDKIKIISDMAFDAVDEDMSGELDIDELG